MRIAVDAMGGDFAPREIVAGTLQAAANLKDVTALYLVGKEDAIREEFSRLGGMPAKVEIVPASEIVGMDEVPAAAVRRKKDSSISRAVDLVKEGKADAVFSAGNTGAAVAATTLKLRTLEGVARPTIAAVFPSPVRPFVLVDAGANTDSTPEMLLQFAVMGSVYAREILGVASPKIGLLSIGGEDAKGNETTKEAFRMLDKSPLDFVGNVEGHDLFSGKIDVVCCDGFVGNVVLKTSESVAHAVGTWLKQEFMRNPLTMLGALLCSRGIRNMKHRSDPDAYGGAPLLGVRGVCVIGHGSSSALAVRNGIRVACEAVTHDINHLIVEQVKAATAAVA